MIRRGAAGLFGLLILGSPGSLFATSFSPYPDTSSPLSSGMIELRVRALQVQVFLDEGSQLMDGSGIGPGTSVGRSGALVRRAEVSASGKVASNVRYLLVADLAADSPMIRDALIDLGSSVLFTLRVGQFRIPFGIETQLPPHALPFVNRTVATFLSEQPDEIPGFLQEWDRGLEVHGEPISGPLNVAYALAIVNGNGLNADDTNSAKDVVGRVGLRLAGFQIGASWYRGKQQDLSLVDRTRNRTGWDIEFNPNPLKALLIRGELIDGDDGSTGHRGWYLLAAYTIADRWTPAVRIERWDPDRSAASDAITRTTLGLTYLLADATSLSLNYEWRDDEGHPGVGNLAVAQLQVSF
jgi:hypothetical protein